MASLSSRRWLIAVAMLSATLQVVGMARSTLPAQDGLKFLRVAHDFRDRPFAVAVRGSDQHPLYPMLVAAVEPAVGLVAGDTPDAWRVAAQLVSVAATVGLLWPLHALTRRAFDARAAGLAVFLYALLPVPAVIGHESLADGLALFFLISALALGERALREPSWLAAAGSGMMAGLGFWTRPEVALAVPVVALAGVFRWRSWRAEFATLGRVGLASATLLAAVGAYAAIKGELSEKLAFRWSAQVGVDAYARPAHRAPKLPRGLDHPRFDFSPKEEADDPSYRGQPIRAARQLGTDWAEGLAYALIPVAAWGLIRGRSLGGSSEGRWVLVIYPVAFGLIAVRHAATLGYLSGRHALGLILVTVPWVAAGFSCWVERFPERRGIAAASARRLGYAGLGVLAVAGIAAQVAKDTHASRWGHRAAGLWLAREADPADAVLDTRGWASFVRGGMGYDYWHVRQALADRRLHYVVVGSDELTAPSRRAATLRAMLAHSGRPVASFPGRRGGGGTGVAVYRFDAPESWERVRP